MRLWKKSNFFIAYVCPGELNILTRAVFYVKPPDCITPPERLFNYMTAYETRTACYKKFDFFHNLING